MVRIQKRMRRGHFQKKGGRCGGVFLSFFGPGPNLEMEEMKYFLKEGRGGVSFGEKKRKRERERERERVRGNRRYHFGEGR